MRRPVLCAILLWHAVVSARIVAQPAVVETQPERRHRIQIETRGDRAARLDERFSRGQLALLEKLNRADLAHLGRLRALAIPEVWGDELSYSVLPRRYPASGASPTFLVVYLPGQLFGAYEFGALVRWGPVSSGSRRHATLPGAFALAWRSRGRASTVDPDWYMPWYFNFGNREGLAFHAYSLPGYPASHGCIRLLERDAQWLFEWGRPWTLDPAAAQVLAPGTPVLIIGQYDFDAAPPWRSRDWLSTTVELPSAPGADLAMPGTHP